MKYKIEITEYLQKTIEVEASDEAEALALIKGKYNNSEIILTSDDFIDKEFKSIK